MVSSSPVIGFRQGSSLKRSGFSDQQDQQAALVLYPPYCVGFGDPSEEKVTILPSTPSILIYLSSGYVQSC
jgi:hypothetical protein